MEVHLTSDQQALARRAVETGHLHREEDAIDEALGLWEERERQRIAFLATIDEARTTLDQGKGRPRLATELAAPR